MANLTKFQRRLLKSDLVCWSGSTGHAWAYDEDGESFDVRPSTVEKLQTLGLLVFVEKLGAVHRYRPARAAK